MNWNEIKDDSILYMGDLIHIIGAGASLTTNIDCSKHYTKCIGLSLSINNKRHIQHDITKPFPIGDNTISYFQSEDVLEHIEYSKLIPVLNEIHRVLKPNGVFRLSVPDYRYDILVNRSVKDENDTILFDPVGGGRYNKTTNSITGGGHVWFPLIENVRPLFDGSNFKKEAVDYLHYYDVDGTPVLNDIDYSKMFIMRTPDHEMRATNPRRPSSMVIDATKES